MFHKKTLGTITPIKYIGVATTFMTDENNSGVDDVSYDIDWENLKLVAYIPHFSHYYFARR